MIIKILYIICKRFIENKTVNLVLMLQIFIALFTLNLTIGSIHKIMYISNVTESSKLNKALYFSVSPWGYAALGNDAAKLDRRLQQIDNVASVGKAAYANCSLPGYTDIRLRLYNKDLLEAFKLPLSMGRWFTDEDLKSDITPVIVSNKISKKYRIGRIIELKVTGSTNKACKIKAKIVGVFDNSNYTLRLGAGGDNLPLPNLFETNENFMIMPEGITTKQSDLKPWDDLGRIFLLSDNNDLDKEYNKIREKVKDIGYVSKIEDMKKQYQSSTREDTLRQFILCFIILVLAISGIGGNNALLQIFKEKEHAIFYACGMSWGTSSVIMMVNTLLNLVIPSIVTYLCLTLPTGWHLLDIMIFDFNNFLISTGVIIFIFIVTSIDPLIALFKTNPITIIRRW